MSEDNKDLIIKLVILKLPVKMLMLFKCVSTDWLHFINSKEFGSLYLQHSKTNSDNLHLFVSSRLVIGPKRIQTFVSVDASRDQTLIPVYSQRFNTDYEIVGCCNGIICLYGDVSFMGFRLALWNAFTRRYKMIPHVRVNRILGASNRFSHGFGHDEVTDDYKVVQIFQSFKDGKLLASDVKVYSSTSNLWTKVEEFPFGGFDFPKKGCFINGALHWLARKMNKSTAKPVVVRFNLGVEKFDLLQVPDVDSIDDLCLGVLGDCLSVCASNEEFSTAVIWVAKNKEPWTWIKQHLVVFGDSNSNEASYCRPLTYTDKGKKLLLAVGLRTVLWYDLRDKEYSKFPLSRFVTGFEVATCIESLVSLGVNSRADV